MTLKNVDLLKQPPRTPRAEAPPAPRPRQPIAPLLAPPTPLPAEGAPPIRRAPSRRGRAFTVRFTPEGYEEFRTLWFHAERTTKRTIEGRDIIEQALQLLKREWGL